jgi:hypothetical protein
MKQFNWPLAAALGVVALLVFLIGVSLLGGSWGYGRMGGWTPRMAGYVLHVAGHHRPDRADGGWRGVAGAGSRRCGGGSLALRPRLPELQAPGAGRLVHLPLLRVWSCRNAVSVSLLAS